MLKVVKFGGTSMADAQHFKMVKDIITSDPARNGVVVSAPGKRFKKDNKVTDLLYLCYAHIKYGVDYMTILDQIKGRYQDIASDLQLNFDVDAAFEKIKNDLENGADQDYLVSRGEFLNANLMAAYLGYDFVDSYGNVFFNFDGSIDTEKTYLSIKAAFENSPGKKIVMPGFFGTMPDGRLSLMSRGGSDITGALLAAALEADVYENWTDVPGILMADPNIVNDQYPIPQITYDELRELTYMGAKVLHEASVRPVRDAGIPLNIRDTGNPSHPGTVIAESFEHNSEDDDKFYITGITGKKGYCIFDVKLDNFAQNLDKYRAVLKVFIDHKANIEQVYSGVDKFSLVVPGEQIKPVIYTLISAVQEICGEGSVSVTEGISLVAIVSRRMVFRPGISGKIFAALGENNVNIRLISQGAEELSIIIGVADADYNKAVQTLYNSFTKRG